MKEQFVTYEISLKLKELGFDEEVIATFDTYENNELKIFAFSVPNKGIFEEGFKKGWCIKAPLYQQVTDWFREKHNIHIVVSGRLVNDPKKKTYKWEVYGDFEEEPGKLYAGLDKDYYTAYNEAILKAIELIKTK